MRSRTLGVAVAALVSFVAASPAHAAPKTEVLQQYVVSGKGADPEGNVVEFVCYDENVR